MEAIEYFFRAVSRYRRDHKRVPVLEFDAPTSARYLPRVGIRQTNSYYMLANDTSLAEEAQCPSNEKANGNEKLVSLFFISNCEAFSITQHPLNNSAILYSGTTLPI